jgi:hypothetical protein
METEIKFGDKVKLVEPSPRTRKNYPSLLVGEEGSVVHISYGYNVLVSGSSQLLWDGSGGVDWANELLYGIEWKNIITNGHNCQGYGKNDQCSYTEAYEIEKI